MTGTLRPTWDQYFVDMLPMISRRSTCRRRQVSAIITVNNRIMATGYNGAPSKVYDCLSRGCLRDAAGIISGQRIELCRAVHAEQNAILHLPHGTGRLAMTDPSTFSPLNQNSIVLYTSLHPCSHCVKSLLVVGINRVVYIQDYPDDLAKDMLTERFVKVEQMDYSPEMKMFIEIQKGEPIEWYALQGTIVEVTENSKVIKIITAEQIIAYVPQGLVIQLAEHLLIPKWLADEKHLIGWTFTVENPK